MLTSKHPSLPSSTLDQYSASETSYRSYREVSYALQSDTHNELQPAKTLLRIYDRQVDDIVTVLIDVVIDISLYSVTRNDETIHHTEVWNNAFMNRLLSETAQITASEPSIPICYDIRKLQTTFRFTNHTYVRANMCRLIRDHIESTLIAFDPEHIDLYTLHVPDDPMPALLSRLISSQIALSPTSLQISSRLTRDWCRQLRYKAIVNATRNVIRLPSVDTRTMINNLLSCRRASQPVFGLPSIANIRTLINGLSNSRPIPRLGLGPHQCCPQASTPHLSQPGPYTRRLIAHRLVCDSILSIRRRCIVDDSSVDSSIDERDIPPLGQRRSSLYDDSTDDESDPPSLRERHMVDSDSNSNSSFDASSLTYRQLARRYGWNDGSSNPSDGSSVPSLEDDSDDSIENEIRYLLPMVGGTPRNPKPIWFPEDEISYHETSSVSSSASSHTSSSSSNDSSRSGQGPFPFEFIDLLHHSTFEDQMRNHRLNSCLTWESWTHGVDVDRTNQRLIERARQRAQYDKHYLPPSRCKIEDLDFDFHPCHNENDEDTETFEPMVVPPSEPALATPDAISSLITPDAGSEVDRTSNFSVASNYLWNTQDTWPDRMSQTMISDGPPRIMPAWTSRLMTTGCSRVRRLAGHYDSPTDVCTQLFYDVSNIQRNTSSPSSWNRVILDFAISQSNYRSSIPSDEIVQHRNISHVADDAINLDSTITESTHSSLTALCELAQDETIQTGTIIEYSSRVLTSRPSMDTQFATLIDIIRRPPPRRPELALSDAFSIVPTLHSLESTPFQVHMASAVHVDGPIVDRPMSHQDWHDEVCDWFGDESSVSSSYTNDSSETNTSDTACMSSSSLNLSQTEHDRSLIVTAMSPLSRSLSLIRLMETPETCPLSTSSHVDPETTNRPLTSSDMLSLRRTLSFSNLPEISHPPTHSSAVSFTALTVEEGVSGSTNTHGTTHGTGSDHSCARTRSSV